MEFNRIIKLLRKERGITQKQAISVNMNLKLSFSLVPSIFYRKMV